MSSEALPEQNRLSPCGDPVFGRSPGRRGGEDPHKDAIAIAGYRPNWGLPLDLRPLPANCSVRPGADRLKQRVVGREQHIVSGQEWLYNAIERNERQFQLPDQRVPASIGARTQYRGIKIGAREQ